MFDSEGTLCSIILKNEIQVDAKEGGMKWP
jgi:hypothetical protein